MVVLSLYNRYLEKIYLLQQFESVRIGPKSGINFFFLLDALLQCFKTATIGK